MTNDASDGRRGARRRAERAWTRVVCVLVVLFFTISSRAHAQEHARSAGGAPSAAEVARANNPLADMNALNFQDYYAPSINGLPGQSSNTMFLRPVVVAGRQIIRATVPLSTVPTGGGDYASGLGDINIFDAILVTGSDAKTEIGVGPLLVLDTAAKSELGAGKWQAGGAVVAIHPMAGGSVLGCLATYQTDFAGDDNRADVSVFAFQPILTLSMGGGYYARSAGAVWVFDLENERYLIPLGIGMGRVFRAAGAVVNVFVEPDFTVYSRGANQPVLQVFFGMNLQWAKKS